MRKENDITANFTLASLNFLFTFIFFLSFFNGFSFSIPYGGLLVVVTHLFTVSMVYYQKKKKKKTILWVFCGYFLVYHLPLFSFFFTFIMICHSIFKKLYVFIFSVSFSLLLLPKNTKNSHKRIGLNKISTANKRNVSIGKC